MNQIYIFSLRLTLLNVKSFEKQREGCLFPFSSTCVSRCPPRSFPNQGGVCWPCHESCEICAGAGQDSCLSCAPAHLRVTDLAVCLQQCPEGYYESMSTKKSIYIHQSQSIPVSWNWMTCNARFFSLHIDTENSTCVPCEANCASCQDRPDKCTSCEHHLVMHENKCYAACPAYTYETQDYSCAPCHATCETCNGTAENQCITCRTGLFALNGEHYLGQ